MLIIPKGNIWVCLISPQHYAYQPGSQLLWIVPLLAWCWRYVLMKKGDDEEGEHLHSWLPEERITAAYYYIKQLGGPTALRLWEMFSPWWHSTVMTPADSEYVACLQWCHCTPVGNSQLIIHCRTFHERTDRKNTSTEKERESFDYNNKNVIYGVSSQNKWAFMMWS